MIPLRDTTRSTGFPVVTVALIVLNVYVFWLELSAGPGIMGLFEKFAVVPAEIVPALSGGRFLLPSSWPTLTTLVTATFLHGGWFHILGNMLYLWVFGDNVENSFGALGFILFYVTVGILGNLAHVAANPASTTPTIGASGAVAGVLGAYFLLFPRARVLSLIPLGIFFTITEVPATLFLLFWFVLQLLSGLGSVAGQMAHTVAWWAHIGGFVAGMALIQLVGIRRRSFS
jgi:membrane associated rhomboid family serine protease